MEKNMFIFLVIVSNAILLTHALKCLDCNENNRYCKGLVVQLDTIGVETCSTRCFVRRARDLGNITIRGCDNRYWTPEGLTIPDNGCAILRNERWCWCDFDDNCNFFDELTLAVINGGFDNCKLTPCRNNGVCKTKSYNGDYECDCSKTDFEGKNCELPKKQLQKSKVIIIFKFLIIYASI